mgnify:CR=1 FL=1
MLFIFIIVLYIYTYPHSWHFYIPVVRRISLSETKITYGTPDGPPKDFIIVNSSSTCHPWTGEDKEFAFRTQTGVDELILCATSEEDRNEWIEAIRNSANPPPPVSSGDPIKDAAAIAEHEAALAKQRAADEAERALKDGMSLGMPSMGSLSVAEHALTGGAVGAMEGAAAGLAGAAFEKARLEKEAADAEAALQAKFARIANPVQCQKKLSNEGSYHARYVWVNQGTAEFHWAKSDDVAKSKCVSIKTMCKSVNTVGEVGAPNFTMDLQNHDSVFTGMFSSVPSGLDVKLEDNELNQCFIDCIRHLMTK